MANRQYIGARYVPKYFENPDGSNAWIPGIEYEALTIVKYAGATFISKIPVPSTIGSPNENTKYWIISNSGGVPQNILEQINQNTDNIATLESEVNAIDTKIDNLVSISKRRWVVLFDSFGTITSDQSNLTIPQVIKNNIGASDKDFYIIAKGGAGFNYTNENSFTKLLQEAIPNIEQPESITDLLIFGGANDAGSEESQVYQGMTEFVTLAKTTFNNAKIGCGVFSRGCSYEQVNLAINTKKYYHRITELSGFYMTNCEYIMHQISLYDTDLLHPKPSKILQLGNELTQWVLNYTGDVIKLIPLPLTVTLPTGTTMIKNELYMYQNNNQVGLYTNEIYGMGAQIKWNNQQTGKNAIVTCTIPDSFIYGNVQNIQNVEIPANIYIMNGNVITSSSGGICCYNCDGNTGLRIQIYSYGDSALQSFDGIMIAQSGSMTIW